MKIILSYLVLAFILFSNTGNAQIGFLKKAKEKFSNKESEDAFYTSEFHKSNPNKIFLWNGLFSSENRINDTINLGEQISFVALLSKPFNEYFDSLNISQENRELKMRFYLDQELLLDTILANLDINGQAKLYGTLLEGPYGKIILRRKLKFDLQRGLNNLGNNEFNNYLVDNYSKFSPGTHFIKIELQPYDSKTMRKGEVISSNQITLIVPSADPGNSSECLPPMGVQYQEILENILKEKSNFGIGKADLVRIELYNSDGWEIQRNDFGAITSRTMTFTVIFKENGTYKYKQLIATQEFVANKFENKSNITGSMHTGIHYSIQNNCVEN